MSVEVLERVTDRSKYHVRGPGKTTPRGTSREVELYEVLDAGKPEGLLKKIETRPIFDLAIAAISEHRYEAAAAHFESIVKSNPADQTAAYLSQYARTAESLDRGEPPSNEDRRLQPRE